YYTSRFHYTDLFEQIFEKIIEIAIKNKLIDHPSLFIDSTHIKINANKNKYIKRIVKKDTLHLQEELNNKKKKKKKKHKKKKKKNEQIRALRKKSLKNKKGEK